jgi:hypothetical protein
VFLILAVQHTHATDHRDAQRKIGVVLGIGAL